MVPAIAATMSTASKTTASLSDAKNSKIELRCQAGFSAEFEVAMRDRHLPRGKCLLQGGTRCPQHVGNKSADSAKLFMPAAPSEQPCAFGDWSPIVFGEADPPPLSDVARKALQKAIREQCETFYSYSRARAILTVAVRLSNVADGQRVLRETRGRWDTNRLSPTWEWPPTSGSERIRCDEFRLGSLFSHGLASYNELILLDNRGIGDSTGDGRPFDIARLADDVTQVIETLGFGRISMLGWSMGGFIAQTLALQHPSRVNKLILLSTDHRRFGGRSRFVGCVVTTRRYFRHASRPG
jgi:hypothetical protein